MDAQIEIIADTTEQTTEPPKPKVTNIDVIPIKSENQEIIQQDEGNGFIGNIVHSIRSLFNLDDSDKYDYLHELAIMEYGNSSPENVNKILDKLSDAGFESAKSDYQAHDVVGNFLEETTVGLYKKPDIRALGFGQALANAVSGFAGLVVGFGASEKMAGEAFKLFTETTKIKDIMPKLRLLTSLEEKYPVFKNALIKAGNGFATYMAVESLVSTAEEQPELYQNIKQAVEAGTVGKIYGSGFSIIDTIKSPIAKGIAGLLLTNAVSKVTTGKFSTLDIKHALQSQDPEAFAQDIMDTLMGLLPVATARIEEFDRKLMKENETRENIIRTKKLMKEFADADINQESILDAIDEVSNYVSKAEEAKDILYDYEYVKPSLENDIDTKDYLNTVDRFFSDIDKQQGILNSGNLEIKLDVLETLAEDKDVLDNVENKDKIVKKINNIKEKINDIKEFENNRLNNISEKIIKQKYKTISDEIYNAVKEIEQKYEETTTDIAENNKIKITDKLLPHKELEKLKFKSKIGEATVWDVFTNGDNVDFVTLRLPTGEKKTFKYSILEDIFKGNNIKELSKKEISFLERLHHPIITSMLKMQQEINNMLQEKYSQYLKKDGTLKKRIAKDVKKKIDKNIKSIEEKYKTKNLFTDNVKETEKTSQKQEQVEPTPQQEYQEIVDEVAKGKNENVNKIKNIKDLLYEEDNNKKNGGSVLWELANAEAGERIATDANAEEWIGIPSSFPDWMPENTRRRAVIDAVLEHIENGTEPKKNATRQWALLDAMQDELERRLGKGKYAPNKESDIDWDNLTDEEWRNIDLIDIFDFGGAMWHTLKRTIADTFGHVTTGREEGMDVSSYWLSTPYQLSRSKNPIAAKTFKKVYDGYLDVVGKVTKVISSIDGLHLSPVKETIKVKYKDNPIVEKVFVDLVNEFDAENTAIKGITKENSKNEYDINDLKEYIKGYAKDKKIELTDEQVNDIYNSIKNLQRFYQKAERQRNLEFKRQLKEIKKHYKDSETVENLIKFFEKSMYDINPSRVFYSHRDRGLGNVFIRVRNEDGKVIYRSENMLDPWAMFTGGKRYLKTTEIKRAEIAKKYPEDKGYTIEVKSLEQSDINKADVGDLFEFFLDVLDNADITFKQKDQILGDMYAKLKSQGFASTTIKRSDRYIEGFNKDVIANAVAYRNKLDGFLRHQKLKAYLNDLEEELLTNYKDDKTLIKAFRSVKNEMLRNKTAMDVVVGKTRGLMYVKYIAGIARPVLVNMLQTPIMTTSHLMNEANIGMAEAHKITSNALTDLLNNKLSEKEQKVMNEIEKQGVFEPQHTKFVSGSADYKDAFIRKSMDYLSYGFSKSETLNRKIAALSYIRVHNDFDFNQLVYGARDFSYYTNGMYGNVNLPMWMMGKDGLKQIMRAGYTFKSYNQQMMMGLLHLYRNNPKAFAHSIGMLILFGGVSAMPLFQSLSVAYSKLTGNDLKQEIINNVNSWIGSKAMSDIMYGGIFSLVGIDLSSSLMIDVPLSDIKYSSDFSDYIMTMVGGVFWSTLKDEYKALTSLRNGEYVKALSYGLPAKFITYPLKAMHDYSIGLTSNNNIILRDPVTGDAIKTDEAEMILQAIGFNPLRISEYKHALNSYITLTNYYANIKHSWSVAWHLAYANQDYEKMNKLIKRMHKINRDIVDKGLVGIVSPIDFKRIRRYDVGRTNIHLTNYFIKNNIGGIYGSSNNK